MLRRAADYIKSHNLIENGDRVLLGVSGGADSVCLLHILSTLYQDNDVEFFVVHVHHGIRDEEADRDEAFVKALCESLKVGYSSYHYDVVSLARKEGLSEEEAGRKVRYEAFTDASIRFKCNKVAIAHNKNDNAETILFNLFRGSAVKGLTGMDSLITMKTDVGSITIIRPLLSITREEIEAYLEENNLQYQDDSTNFSNAYSRNKIRNQILVYARDQINTNVIEHITNAADHLDEAYVFIENYINNRYQAIVRECGKSYEYLTHDLDSEDIVIRKGIIRKILGELSGSLKDIEAKHVNDVLSLGKKQVGKMINLPYGMIALKKYDRIKLYIEYSKSERDFFDHEAIVSLDLVVPGRIDLEQYGAYIEAAVFDYKKNLPFPKNSCMKWFDYDKIENTLKLRTRNTGDYLQIDSQGGRKKLKDYFIDMKIPKEERDGVLLVADGSHILWVIGYGNRISEKYKISNETKQILSMNYICKGEVR
ncbi:MAG: tRNA lysidine(34) synthetase TilS [Anaerolineaceae bacterium]|nr:MAG: tRNA lysidine(34) synthetase TilS [Anaerolineaceae bacterium]